jgi:hypothetical protein
VLGSRIALPSHLLYFSFAYLLVAFVLLSFWSYGVVRFKAVSLKKLEMFAGSNYVG